MKNLSTFEDFVNESLINEALDGNTAGLAKDVANLTTVFMKKDLPSLLKKYGCTSENQKFRGTTKIRISNTQGLSFFDIYLWSVAKISALKIIATGYPDVFNDKLEIYKVLPFNDATKNPDSMTTEGFPLVAKLITNWQFLESKADSINAEVVKEYKAYLDNYLKGIEENLNYLKDNDKL